MSSIPERRRLPEREKRPIFEDDRFKKRDYARDEISLPIRRLPRQPFVNPVQEYGYYTEYSFFQAVKEKLGNNLLFHEFLRSIDLLGQDMISKEELVALVKELLIDHKDLFKSFKKFIGYKSEKKEEEEEETEEATSTKESKNSVTYEVESLSPEEEERFELDLLLDLNQSTMRALDNLLDASYVTNTPPLPETLDVLHIRNIERVYGDRSNELIEALFVNPLAAVPVIQKRLRQKNQEWTNAKKELNKEVNNTNNSSKEEATTPIAVK
jgi:paired amphipathic helix protein Sin3a